MGSQIPAFRMNLPNVLTLARFVMVPIFMLFLTFNNTWSTVIALVVFSVAALTDFFDGYLARKLNQVTTFGKFIDPMADKLLMVAAWLAFIEMGDLSAIAGMILIGRELLVTGLRVLAASQGTVIPAGPLGKAKTVIHIIMVIAILLSHLVDVGVWDMPITATMIWVSVIISFVSGIQYFYNAKSLFSSEPS